MGIVNADFGGRRLRKRIIQWSLVALAAIAIIWWLPALLGIYTEWLWFKFDVGYGDVFWKIFSTKVGLGVFFGGVFFLVVLGNIELVRRWARRTLWYDEERALRQRIAEAMEYFAGRYLYFALALFTLFVSYVIGDWAASQWNQYLLFGQGGSFGTSDPVFNRDIGFYVFRLPFWQFLWSYAYYLLVFVFIVSAAAHYLDKAIRVLKGVPAFAPHVKSHLSVILGLLLVLKALDYRLDAFLLLYSPRGATFGASYTDVHAQLFAYNVLFVIALACAALVLINIYSRGLWLPIAGIGFLGLSSLLLNSLYPSIVQRVQVIPNEFAREKPYITHTIAFTRQGFDLDRVDARELLRVSPLSADAVKNNVDTVENLRLWDYRPLLQTLRQQQALWPYYEFYSVDVDRYWVDGRYRQVMLAARELSTPGLPEKGWQNEHVFNTHGYGVVMAPVSDVIQSGLPNLIMKDIPPRSSFDLQVTQPSIYYGELTNDYILTGTTEDENDYPLPGSNVMARTRYDGAGGVPIGSPLPRLAASVRFGDVNILISNIVGKNSKVHWNRNIGRRAKTIVPFLSLDQDPYVVVGADGRLYWIQDAYTTSDMYPYSEPYTVATGRFNYVRNSVKIVTDAYDGTVQFYVADPEDRIIATYQRVFPDVFKPLTEMPSDLLDHIRYPEALFNTQSEQLRVYHMTDPMTFYNRIEKWEIAKEHQKSVNPGGSIFSPRSSEGEGEKMQAYYAIIRLPNESEPEFLLMLPFTPQERPNMVAWLAARCDGEEYGRMLLYNFPKTEQVWGPIQIEASIDQDDIISEWITLRNQQGSQVLRGNLLVIPLDSTILYVEPLYLQASQSKIPELKQIVLARGDGHVSMQPTLSLALEELLGSTPPELSVVEPSRYEVVPAARQPQAATPATEPTAGVPVTEIEDLAEQANRQLKEARDRLD
ncbi:MAG: UPF0182 family protein, partial [Armatimonadetes bacterium]|nr:UPF0182 family protein [Armatimonadota bacterium]